MQGLLSCVGIGYYKRLLQSAVQKQLHNIENTIIWFRAGDILFSEAVKDNKMF
jgi:hypothetical protein